MLDNTSRAVCGDVNISMIRDCGNTKVAGFSLTIRAELCGDGHGSPQISR